MQVHTLATENSILTWDSCCEHFKCFSPQILKTQIDPVILEIAVCGVWQISTLRMQSSDTVGSDFAWQYSQHRNTSASQLNPAVGASIE